ncbi:MAG: biotin carboxylase N-terminal domain-containing protein [Pseudomonadota bacterium]
MFDRILIANRGEIACRIMRTAKGMGVSCVAVHSDVDADALHVEMADAAVEIGGAAPEQSYLRGDAIIQAALETGAEAIHPGYGFLSENPAFVDAVEAAGLVFIGPSAEAIRAMGLKDAAKALMVEAGVPVVPGYHEADQSDARLEAAAAEVGYPVLIKAVAGGGGKGMRLVETAGDFPAALASARSEAQTAFGNPDVLVEKFIANPRHIEVQIFGDGTRALHLFERDCSLQRRHQKVIEEAPAPGMPEDLRAAMGAAAVRAAEAIGYSGAGTVEFIVDGSGPLRPDGFYFMEMNTRLQVEHPVTEAITGIDLVEWQLRVAAGALLPATQEDITMSGHAFEARLYAEDVPAGFLPATGRLDHIAFPNTARADTGVRSGDEISPYYDPMIAKLVVHGPTRDVALAKLAQALAGCEVAGTVTNLAFLGALATHERFRAGNFDTGLIARDLALLTVPPAPSQRHWIAAGMAALGLTTPPAEAGFTLWQPLRQRVKLQHGKDLRELCVEVLGDRMQHWFVGDEKIAVERQSGQWLAGGIALPSVHRWAERLTVFDRYGLLFEVHDPLVRAEDSAQQGNVIEAPMPGLVKLLAVSAGEPVQAGARLAVLEAMKMEHSLLASRDGVVAEVLIVEGAQVSAGQALVVLEDEEAS